MRAESAAAFRPDCRSARDLTGGREVREFLVVSRAFGAHEIGSRTKLPGRGRQREPQEISTSRALPSSCENLERHSAATATARELLRIGPRLGSPSKEAAARFAGSSGAGSLF